MARRRPVDEDMHDTFFIHMPYVHDPEQEYFSSPYERQINPKSISVASFYRQKQKTPS